MERKKMLEMLAFIIGIIMRLHSFQFSRWMPSSNHIANFQYMSNDDNNSCTLASVQYCSKNDKWKAHIFTGPNITNFNEYQRNKNCNFMKSTSLFWCQICFALKTNVRGNTNYFLHHETLSPEAFLSSFVRFYTKNL